MTARSDRRNAELLVLETADAWYEHRSKRFEISALDFSLGVNDTTRRLTLAVECLRAERLMTPGRARANVNAPVTAEQAAIWMDGQRSRGVSARIIRYLYAERRYGGVTVDHLEQALNGRHQTISARVNELRDLGWIYDTGAINLTRSGRTAICWRLTSAALEHLAKY